MGQEIVDCFKGRIRLTGADLDRGHGIRWNHPESLPPEERRAVGVR